MVFPTNFQLAGPGRQPPVPRVLQIPGKQTVPAISSLVRLPHLCLTRPALLHLPVVEPTGFGLLSASLAGAS